jgi:hypothetical protein
MKIELEFPFSEAELRSALQAVEETGKPTPLRVLCQKEVSRFEATAKQHPDYADGLVQIERFAVEGYLFQKLRGHIDANPETIHCHEERQDGQT